MSAMSASSAAPAGLMPLSLIAEHKSSQASSSVQSLPRSGTDKCATPGSMAKPTANGMEGPNPLPLVSQLPQTNATLPPAMPELSSQHSSTTNSDIGVQPPTHGCQSSHQNVMKPSDTGAISEDNGTPFTGTGSNITAVFSGEKHHTEETIVQHNQMSSSTTCSLTTISTSTVEHSRTTTIPSLLMQIPSTPTEMHSIASPDTTSSAVLSSALLNTTETAIKASSVHPVNTALTVHEESVTHVQETATTTTEVKTLESTVQKQTIPIDDNGSPSHQPSNTAAYPSIQPEPLQVSVNNSPQKTSIQPLVSQAGNAIHSTNPPSSQQIPASNVTSQQQTTDHATMKAATLPRQSSKRTAKPITSSVTLETPKKSAGERESSTIGDKPRRKRLPTQPYQSPIPELNIIAKYKKMKEMNEKDEEKKPSSSSTEKLIVFYRNEFLAVRNAEGSFYVCQAMQNVYKSSSRIRIRWLSQHPDPSTDLYTPDFYDHTEFDCILTNLNLERVEKDKFRLPPAENRRTESILQRAIDVERGVAPPPADDTLTETHPDGLDLSLYRNEEQLKKRKKSKKKSGRKKESGSGEEVKRVTSSTTRGNTGTLSGSTVSAAAVAKAKKAAAIKRTAAVKRVVQQAAAARRQASVAAASATASATSSSASNKKSSTTTVTLPNRASPASNTTGGSKKENKVPLTSTVTNKRKPSTLSGSTTQDSSPVTEKRTRRGIAPQNQNTTSTNTTQPKSRGNPGSSGNSNSTNKNMTSNNCGTSGTNTSTTAASGNNGTMAGSTRRTLRNSK